MSTPDEGGVGGARDVPVVPLAARQMTPADLFAYLGGSAVFEALVAGFYRRVRTDDVLAPMYPPHDFAGAERRLRMFLEQYWGGPDTYGRERGAPMLRRRHLPFEVDDVARERWLTHMLASLAEVEMPEDGRAVVRDYLERAAAAMVNR